MYALQKDRYYRFPMINLKIQMQEQENLARQLQKLQEECVNDYLQSRLQTITSKEVIREIIQGFIAVNNEQFFQSISETIQTVKQNNKYLAEQMETLKKQHTFEVDELSKKIYESEQLQQKIKIELNGELSEKSNQLRSMVQQKQSEKQTLLKISQHQKAANLQLQKQLLQKEQLVVLLQQKLNKTNRENNLLTLQVEKTKESSMKFKESCEKILKEANKQREKQKEKLVESWNNQKQIMQQQIQQLKNEIRTKQMLWEEKSCLEEQSKQQLLQNLKAEIIEINQQLNLSRQQILTRVAQSQQLADRMNQMSKNLQKLQKQNQTSHVSNLYLQEESNYLRNQIIQFDTRYKQLEEEKIQLEHNFNYFKASKNAELGSTEKALEQLSLEHKQTVQKITEQTSTTLQNITAELQFLKQRELIYRQNESTLITRQQQIQNLLMDCQQENKCMTEQLQLHCADNEVHQKQIKLYQESIIKLNQDFRAQMEAQKQFFETNWKETNEELLQEKYRCLKLRQQLEKAKEEISLFHQKQQIYVLYHQEIAQLKSQLALISSYQAQKNTFKGQFKSKTYFLLSRASQEVKKLKKQNRSLRQSVIKLIKQHREQIEQMFTVTVLKIRQQSLKCLFCEHQKTLKNNQKTAIQQLMLKKTMPRLGNNQSMNYSHIKKALKTVNQRYQTLNQENKHYTDHIEGVIGKI